jgi:hypothetical protein
MLPKGFKLAAKNEISKEVKEKNKVYTSHHTVLNSTIYLLLDQSLENSPRVNFPVVAPDPEKIRILSI